MKDLKYKILFFLFSILSIASIAAQSAFYWEQPELFVQRAGSFPVTSSSENFSALAWQEITPNRDPAIAANGLINIHLAVKDTNGEWLRRGVVAGHYSYSGTEPSILSIVIDNAGKIIIAAAASNNQTDILISEDKGENFSRQTISMGAESSVAPRIFVRADGGYLLFVTRGTGQALAIHYSRSDDGKTWSPFEPFVSESDLSLSFLPAHASSGQREIVFFQSLITDIETAATFQLYFKTSGNGGRTWSAAQRFTSFQDPLMQTEASPNSFDNQRVNIAAYGNNFLLSWERRFGSQPPHIYSAIIDSSGNLLGQVERVNSEEAYCNNPVGFIYENIPTIVWFDNRSGNNRIVLAQHDGISWQNFTLSSANMDSFFARPIVSNDGLFIIWQSSQQAAAAQTDRIYLLSPDRSVEAPRIAALNFNPAVPSRGERVRFGWNIPYDTSGIFGFSSLWSQNENAVPPKEVTIFNTGNSQNLNLENTADSDGAWYFSIIAQDFAGNWSQPARTRFYKKTTPPPPLAITEPQKDEQGFLVSNTFNIEWDVSSDPFVSGYTWNLQFLGANSQTDIEQAAYNTPRTLTRPPSRIMGTSNSVRYNNYDNGLWAFSVSAIDQAGNIGEPSTVLFKTNKFIPYTIVNAVDARQDEQGNLSIRMIGRGFSTDGQITSIILENEKGQETSGGFTILSDREISGLAFENLDEGQYRIKLEHSGRGQYIVSSPINVARSVTVKLGDYTKTWKPYWTIQSGSKIVVNPIMILAAALIVFGALGSLAAIRGIAGTIAESAAVKQEVHAIITGEFMPTEKKQKIIRIKRKGRGLAFKLASFTIALVLSVIVMISTPMYLIMTGNQRETLLQSLYARSNVLLEGLASSAKAYMPQGEQGVLELGLLPAQSAALPEAKYVTITGYSAGSVYSDHVLATNDPDILDKVDTAEFSPGVSRITDALTPSYGTLSESLNNKAKNKVGDLSKSIQELTQEGITLASRFDAASQQRLADIQVTVNSLEVRLAQILSEIGGSIDSVPEFTNENIFKEGNRNFIFYKPVMFRQGADDNYFRGLVRLEVSLDSIMEQIAGNRIILLGTIAIVAFAALIIGIIGALIFSNLIIRPIRKLVSHIEMIRDTENKEQLAGKDIHITSGDELAILGDTINGMTQGLVKAAAAAADLSIGKEIQKKFIPLDVDKFGNKMSSGFKETKHLDFFGYYEGAKGVSGDYFDFKDLDGRYYAIIKCDVAGKGIPAALIMIQVATMFVGYFRRWKPDAKGLHIEDLVYQINEFIEALGFKGRFAAFTLCLFDSVTGTVRFCNAGDNIIHYYDASEKKVKAVTLPATPATGVLPNFMIETSGGYQVQTLKIDKGDILLLFTDGIEEAKRKFRDSDFKEIICTEVPKDTPHENHLGGQGDEEMGADRVEEIINAVMAGEVYTMRKYHNPEEVTELQFDFSSCQGKVEEVIMALAAVEKMFRCYKDPSAAEESRILVDKKIDEFLKNHFIQYRRYCAHTKEFAENEEYMYYTNVKEDEQYDDLTILGIKRK